ncbi:hypothetical protein ACLK1T_02090 [Escherichia coli]
MLTDVSFSLLSLAGHFLDRLRGMETLRIFGRGELKLKVFVLLRKISANGQWKCYGWHFYSSAFSNFFTSLSIALAAVVLWFSDRPAGFGHYDTGELTLAAGFLARSLRQSFSSHYAIERFITPKPRLSVQLTV